MIFVPRLLFFVLGSNFVKDKSNLLFGTAFFVLYFFLCWGQILGKHGPAGWTARLEKSARSPGRTPDPSSNYC